MITGIEVSRHRKPEYEIDPLFVNRWSPRAMSGEELNQKEIMTLFEAARWAPSSYNNQPWRFLYARRDTDNFKNFYDLLSEGNRKWTQNAALLVVVVSKTTFDHNGKPSRTHSFDSGAAWENLALQGTLMGLAVHAMQGFDYDRAREVLKVPDDYQVQAMIAVGRPGAREDLPPVLQEREVPSGRKEVSQIAMEGAFPKAGS